MNCELPDVQAGFRRARGTRDPGSWFLVPGSWQTPNICWIITKAKEFQKKTFTSTLLIMPMPLTEWITTNCGKF